MKQAFFALTMLAATPAMGAGLAEDPKFLEIVNRTFVVEAVKQSCPSVGVRMLRSQRMIADMAEYVSAQGYSQSEMKDALVDPAAQAGHMARAQDYIRSKGYDLSKPQSYCAFAKDEKKARTEIGKLFK
ncbi:DUF5333 family protein [Aliiroseovarius sp. PTFE2010]|uniref:DUF5333 family protein n=1 Tax=Aliiroseovarius sp. PTFE2010 TaxID=3417190 RepID=UPI003CFA0B9C